MPTALRAEGSPGAKPVLRADGLPTLPERAVHKSLSHRGHLDRARRHRSHRLRLVHRLPVLHGRLSVWRTPLQLGCAVGSPGRAQSIDALSWQPAPAKGRRGKVLVLHSARAGRSLSRVSRTCPTGARNFGNLLDPESEIRYILDNKRVLLLKQELNTMPKFFYFYGT